MTLRRSRAARLLELTVAVGIVGVLTGCSGGAAEPAPAPSAVAEKSRSTPKPSPTRTAAPTPTPTVAPEPAPEPAPEVVVPEPVAPAVVEPAPAPAPEPAPVEATPAPEPEPVVPAGIRKGDSGPEVLALQQRLQELGYFLPSADSSYGSATQQAVWALQKAAGLGRDGIVGPGTQTALDAGVRPTPRSTSGRVLEVDLARQLLLTVEDGVVTKIVNASSGNNESYTALGRPQKAYTPTGSFSLYREVNGIRESSLELGSMYRPKYFKEGWAVHGSPSIPPYPASHGCVRVSNAAMDWLWDTWGAPIGTSVLVY